ncbi:MAG: hypothetical protein J2P36_09900 [Ktedonobacteraceae bacterium]|nr:hypothetical protein [Ktedonobacteraceae bacterium]
MMEMLEQSLAVKTRVTHRHRTRQYGASLAQRPPTTDDLLQNSDYAIQDYKTYLKNERQPNPTSVNLALAAIGRFHQFIGGNRPHVQRKSLSAQAPRVLKREEQNPFLWAVEHTPMVCNQAIAHRLFYTTILRGEWTEFNLGMQNQNAYS